MEKTTKPSKFQRALHRILMLRPVTAIFIRIQHRLDAFTWKLTGGRFSFTGALGGVPIYKVTTIGAKSGLPRSLPLVGIPDGDRIGLIASNFGQAHQPSWYYNLKTNPDCQVQVNGSERAYTAHEAEGQEYERYWNMAVSFYAGYALYKIRAGRRHIPVMVLKTRKELPES